MDKHPLADTDANGVLYVRHLCPECGGKGLFCPACFGIGTLSDDELSRYLWRQSQEGPPA